MQLVSAEGMLLLLQLEEDDPDVKALLSKTVPVVKSIPMEEFNNYAFIIDVDGNSWSDRFARLTQFNTPILKQETTENKEYFVHHVKNGSHVTFFRNDLKDLVAALEKNMEEYKNNICKYEKMVRNLQSFAREHLSHIGALRAAAYILNVYATKITWTPEMEEGFVEIEPSICCSKNPTLPAELQKELRMSKS